MFTRVQEIDPGIAIVNDLIYFKNMTQEWQWRCVKLDPGGETNTGLTRISSCEGCRLGFHKHFLSLTEVFFLIAKFLEEGPCEKSAKASVTLAGTMQV